MVVFDGLEVGMLHGVFGGDPLGVVIAQHLVKQVEGLLCHQLVVVGVHEFVPGLAGLVSKDIVVMAVE